MPDSNQEGILAMCDGMANDAQIFIRVFQVRAASLSRKIDLLGLLGLLTPLLIGGIVLVYGTGNPYMDYLIRTAFAISIVQLLMSGWAVAQKWSDKLAYYYEAMQDLSSIKDEFTKIKNAPNPNEGFLFHAFEINRVKYDIRVKQNLKYNISSCEIKDAENHFKN